MILTLRALRLGCREEEARLQDSLMPLHLPAYISSWNLGNANYYVCKILPANISVQRQFSKRLIY